MNGAEPGYTRRPHSPPAFTLLSNLSDVGDALAGQFAEIQRYPTPPRCEQLSINLQGAARMVMRIRQGLLADSELSRDPV